MKHPASRQLFSYWDALRGERTAPERSEIDPGAIRHILADTFVLEVDPDRSFPFRLAGTRLCALYGRELKGLPLASLWPETKRGEANELAETVLSEMCGVVAGLAAATRAGIAHDLELLLLPVRHGGKTHARLLGCLTADSVPPWIGLDPILSQRVVASRVIRPVAPLPDPTAFGWSRHSALPEAGPQPERRRHLSIYEGGRSEDGGSAPAPAR